MLAYMPGESDRQRRLRGETRELKGMEAEYTACVCLCVVPVSVFLEAALIKYVPLQSVFKQFNPNILS